jgi:hypothetical protein
MATKENYENVMSQLNDYEKAVIQALGYFDTIGDQDVYVTSLIFTDDWNTLDELELNIDNEENFSDLRHDAWGKYESLINKNKKECIGIMNDF